MTPVQTALEPRKTPVQARSNASVHAILQAAVQVLAKEGIAKTTTKKIAARAGVSIGTLYQYFPNKHSLLYVLFKQRLESFENDFDKACLAMHGARLGEMADALASAFVAAKFGNPETSIALYAAAGQCDGCRRMRIRTAQILAATIATASDREVVDPHRVAKMVFSAMAGVSRDIVAAGLSRNTMSEMELELTQLLRACLLSSSISMAWPSRA